MVQGWRPQNYGKSKEQPDDEDFGNSIDKNVAIAANDQEDTDLVMFNTIYVQREYGEELLPFRIQSVGTKCVS